MSKITLIKQPYAPIIEYTPLAMHKIRHVVRTCKKEVGWFGSVSMSEGEDYKYFLIEDIFLPTQTVSGTETDVEAKDLIALFEEAEKLGFDPGTLFYWGHSHVQMAPNPSGQDEKQLMEYADAYPVFLRGIYNKDGDERMDVFDFANNIRFDLVDTEVMVPAMTEDQEKSLDALIKDRVNEHVYTGPTPWNKGVNSRGKKPGYPTPPANPYHAKPPSWEGDFYDSYGHGYGDGDDDLLAPLEKREYPFNTASGKGFTNATGMQSRR